MTPTLKELCKEITPEYAAHWKRIGVFLDIRYGVLDTIESEYFRNCRECCDRMLATWLDVDVNASWRKLNSALDSAVLKLNSPSKSMYLGSYI